MNARDRHGASAPCALVAIALLIASGSSQAFTCSASTTPVAFGAYDVFATGNVDSTGTVVVTCSTQTTDPIGNFSVTYEVELGTGGSGNTSQRRLTSGANTLDYNLYRNNARSQLWGDGVTAPSVSASFTLNRSTTPSRTRAHTVFGRIPPLQDVAVGNYADNVLVTLNF
ncbi:MAG: spore coat U domain-containing protein [Burkholderiales bacterium]